MKARIPKHREFVIQFPENYDKSEECWGKLQQIIKSRANPYIRKALLKTTKKK